MERIGDLETSTIQHVAASLAAKYGSKNGDANVGDAMTITTKTAPFSSEVRIMDHGRLVFAATTWADGDQIVCAHQRGD